MTALQRTLVDMELPQRAPNPGPFGEADEEEEAQVWQTPIYARMSTPSTAAPCTNAATIDIQPKGSPWLSVSPLTIATQSSNSSYDGASTITESMESRESTKSTESASSFPTGRPGNQPGNQLRSGKRALRSTSVYPSAIQDGIDDCSRSKSTVTSMPVPIRLMGTAFVLQQARESLLQALAISHGATDSPLFQRALSVLTASYNSSQLGHSHHYHFGTWLALTTPTFAHCLGETSSIGDPMHTLGQMSFGMFSPTDLICSLQGNFNEIRSCNDIESVPFPNSTLRDAVLSGQATVRVYNIRTAFTIEPSSPDMNVHAPNHALVQPVRGMLTTLGYCCCYRNAQIRKHDVWITGGRIETEVGSSHLVAASVSRGMLHRLLARTDSTTTTTAGKTALTNNNTANAFYVLRHPAYGGANVETLYLDASLRIVRGHRGTLFVFSRVAQ